MSRQVQGVLRDVHLPRLSLVRPEPRRDPTPSTRGTVRSILSSDPHETEGAAPGAHAHGRCGFDDEGWPLSAHTGDAVEMGRSRRQDKSAAAAGGGGVSGCVAGNEPPARGFDRVIRSRVHQRCRKRVQARLAPRQPRRSPRTQYRAQRTLNLVRRRRGPAGRPTAASSRTASTGRRLAPSTA